MSTRLWFVLLPLVLLGAQEPPPTVPKTPPVSPPQVLSSPSTPPEEKKSDLPDIPTPPPLPEPGKSAIQPTKLETPQVPPDADFHIGVSLLENNNPKDDHRAMKYLTEYLKTHPSSRHAPEATYRLAMAHLVFGDKKNADKWIEALVERHTETFWAVVAMNSYLDHPQLKSLWAKQYQKVREENDKGSASQVAYLLQISARRFPNNFDKSELAYRLAMCYRTLEDEKGYALVMAQAKSLKADSDWAKLANFQLGDVNTFRKNMDELVRLGSTDGENNRVFLELLEKHRPQLTAEEKIKSCYYQACCLSPEKTKERKELWNQIITASPRSEWGRKASFALAEVAYAKGQRTEAFQRYRKLLKDFASFPGRDKVARWVESPNQMQESGVVLREVVGGILSRINAGKGGVACTVEVTQEGVAKRLAARVAHDGSKTILDVQYGQAAFFFAGAKEKSWLLMPGGKELLVSEKGLEMPSLNLFGSLDPKTGKWNVNFNTSEKDQAHPIRCGFSKETVVALLRTWLSFGHVSMRSVKPTGNTKQAYALTFDYLCSGPDPDIRTVEALVEDGNVRSVTLTCVLKEKRTVIRMNHIRIGEPVDAHMFAIPKRYAQLPTRRTQEDLAARLWMHLMLFGTEISQEFLGDADANARIVGRRK